MKRTKFLRILAIGTILALLLAMVPAIPALAAEEVELDPEEGEIGDKIEVTGSGFDESSADEDVFVYIFMSPEDADVDDDDIDQLDVYEKLKTKSTDTDGDFETYFYVPERLADGDDEEDVTGGTYYIYTTYSLTGEIKSQTEFTVLAAEIAISPDEGKVGEEVDIDGIDFEGREDIEVTYDDDDIDIESGDDTTDSSGGFSLTITVPESTAGEHTIEVTAGDSSAEATFTVEPEITLSSATGAPNDQVTVKGTGFGGSADVDIEFDGSVIQTTDTDAEGSFEINITIPVKSSGTYTIEAEDDDRNKASENFTVASAVTLAQTTGNIGDQITINGAGFTPNTQVRVTYTSTPVVVATPTADSNGKFTATFTVPRSTHGPHQITATDGVNTTSPVTFNVESTPPPVPTMVLPEDDTKASSTATFEWEAVTDPSEPVTYSLQVAADSDFATILVQQTGIEETTYTLTKEERLDSTKKEEPYYWRVQAVDGADNESGWTAPNSFYVGFSFAIGGWAQYLLMGIGAIVLLLIGILVGRRLAYY
jgi:hypothetical protein